MKRRRRDGFTIIEVLIAVALMSIALSGVAMTGIVSMRADTTGHLASAATTLAQTKLDELRNMQRDEPDWSEGTHNEYNLNENGVSASGSPFTRRWVVDLGYNNHADLARVTVDVMWSGGGPVTLSALYW
jgi:prepilin-type N-terminal cleavage/methylation domain-containing protein